MLHYNSFLTYPTHPSRTDRCSVALSWSVRKQVKVYVSRPLSEKDFTGIFYYATKFDISNGLNQDKLWNLKNKKILFDSNALNVPNSFTLLYVLWRNGHKAHRRKTLLRLFKSIT